MKLTKEAILELLEARHEQYNRPSFVEEDPISIPHSFSRKEDIEIAGFLTALIAWGKRTTILASAARLMDRMDQDPFGYVMGATEGDLGHLEGFVHRTFNAMDARALVLALRGVYQHHGGLEGAFTATMAPTTQNVQEGIMHARNCLIHVPEFPLRTRKHVANPAKGSSAKRINMFLRWMVRKDKRGVDFGLWEGISPRQLICPLDVHTGNVGRRLGLLGRKQNDWKAAVELTSSLRAFCPEDPVKYDFSLFGLGVYEDF